MGYTFPENEWVNITLPLEEIGAANETLTLIRIGGQFSGTFYLDNIRLVSSISETSYTIIFFLFPTILYIRSTVLDSLKH